MRSSTLHKRMCELSASPKSSPDLNTGINFPEFKKLIFPPNSVKYMEKYS